MGDKIGITLFLSIWRWLNDQFKFSVRNFNNCSGSCEYYGRILFILSAIWILLRRVTLLEEIEKWLPPPATKQPSLVFLFIELDGTRQKANPKQQKLGIWILWILSGLGIPRKRIVLSTFLTDRPCSVCSNLAAGVRTHILLHTQLS